MLFIFFVQNLLKYTVKVLVKKCSYQTTSKKDFSVLTPFLFLYTVAHTTP